MLWPQVQEGKGGGAEECRGTHPAFAHHSFPSSENTTKAAAPPLAPTSFPPALHASNARRTQRGTGVPSCLPCARAVRKHVCMLSAAWRATACPPCPSKTAKYESFPTASWPDVAGATEAVAAGLDIELGGDCAAMKSGTMACQSSPLTGFAATPMFQLAICSAAACPLLCWESECIMVDEARTQPPWSRATAGNGGPKQEAQAHECKKGTATGQRVESTTAGSERWEDGSSPFAEHGLAATLRSGIAGAPCCHAGRQPSQADTVTTEGSQARASRRTGSRQMAPIDHTCQPWRSVAASNPNTCQPWRSESMAPEPDRCFGRRNARVKKWFRGLRAARISTRELSSSRERLGLTAAAALTVHSAESSSPHRLQLVLP